MTESESPQPQAPVVSAAADSGLSLCCPMCEYDVRGLPEPRCPECGHRFEWAELSDPARQRLNWFFEHRRWLGGYVATQWRLLVPWRFWRTVRPAHQLRAGRLWLFFLIGILAPILFTVVLVIGHAADQTTKRSRA